MSTIVSGALSVQRIHGANGEFCVGKLECELGTLNIKDPHLDQYEDGKYEGRFGIEKIFPNGYMTRTGAFIVEIRAIIHEYIIFSDEPEILDSDDVALKDEDPLESTTQVVVPEPKKAKEKKPEPKPTPKPEAVEKPTQDVSGGDSTAAELFGELWPLGDKVQLDPTTIRSDALNHRKRIQYLGDHGYTFRASSQSWEKTEKPQETLL